MGMIKSTLEESLFSQWSEDTGVNIMSNYQELTDECIKLRHENKLLKTRNKLVGDMLKGLRTKVLAVAEITFALADSFEQRDKVDKT